CSGARGRRLLRAPRRLPWQGSGALRTRTADVPCTTAGDRPTAACPESPRFARRPRAAPSTPLRRRAGRSARGRARDVFQASAALDVPAATRREQRTRVERLV